MHLRRLYSTGVASIESPAQTSTGASSVPNPECNASAETAKTGLWREIRKYPKIAIFCVGLMFSGSLLSGYDAGISGNMIALPKFQSDFGELYESEDIIPSLWISLWNAATSVGLMAGALAGGWLGDFFGRRISLLIGTITSAMALIVLYFPNSLNDMDSRRSLYLVGRVFQGAAMGVMGSTSQTFMSEIAPRNLQGPVMALLPFGELLGELLGAAVMAAVVEEPTAHSYLDPIASQWGVLLIPFLVAAMIPESPAWLVRTGKVSALSKASLTRLHTKQVDIQAILNDLETLILRGDPEHDTDAVRYIDCFKGTNRRRTYIVIFSSALPVLFGLPLLSQASYFAQNYGMDDELSLLLLLVGAVVGMIANAIGIFVLSKIGRRKLILSSLGISTILWLGMGIAGCWSGMAVVGYSSATMITVVLVNGLGSWPASYAVSSEVSSLRLRSRSQGIGWFSYSLANGAMGMILPYIYNADAGDLQAKTGFVIMGTCLCGVVLAWFLVPEMIGRSNADIDNMFSLRLPTRDFRRWASESDGTHELRPVVSEKQII